MKAGGFTVRKARTSSGAPGHWLWNGNSSALERLQARGRCLTPGQPGATLVRVLAPCRPLWSFLLPASPLISFSSPHLSDTSNSQNASKVFTEEVSQRLTLSGPLIPFLFPSLPHLWPSACLAALGALPDAAALPGSTKPKLNPASGKEVSSHCNQP